LIFRKFRIFCILWILTCCIPSPSGAAMESLPEENPVYRRVQAIYERLVLAFGEGRLPPRLLVIPKGTKVREPIASSSGGNEGGLAFEASSGMLAEGYVAIEERTVEVLASLGRDQDNAIAFLLAHELAHVYLHHGWVGDFGNSFARTDMGRKMMKAATYEEVVKRETEADHFGGFYGYLAGFDTLDVAPRALERIYAGFGLPDQLPNYPSRAERVAIAERQIESLKKLVPIYDAGNRLLILGHYEEAGRIFTHLAQIFPSREMFNNAGVAFALEAVRLLPPKAIPYAYPFELDAETRLQDQEQNGRRIARAGREDDQSVRRVRLLRRALNAFEQAARRDSRYAAARINCAAVQSLLGEQDEAIRLAGAALVLAREEDERVAAGHALVVRGIALARTGELQRARSELLAARQVVPELADINIAALEGRAAPVQAAAPNDVTGRLETIGGYSARQTLAHSGEQVSFSLSPAEKGEPALAVHSWRGPGWDCTVVDLEGRRIGTASAGPTYQGSSARGLHVGSPLASLGQLYGNADRVVPSRQGAWYVYNADGIVFEVDAAGKVCGWFLFALR